MHGRSQGKVTLDLCPHFSMMTQAFDLKQDHPNLRVVPCFLLDFMPRQVREPVRVRGLQNEKAYQSKQLRIKTERMIAQLKQESYKVDLSEA
jgi:hypothetical protein